MAGTAIVVLCILSLVYSYHLEFLSNNAEKHNAKILEISRNLKRADTVKIEFEYGRRKIIKKIEADIPLNLKEGGYIQIVIDESTGEPFALISNSDYQLRFFSYLGMIVTVGFGIRHWIKVRESRKISRQEKKSILEQ